MAYTTTALAILFTLGRFVIHYRKNKRLGLDDAFNGIAAIFLLGFLITWQRYTPAAYQAELYQLGLDKTNPAQLPPRLFQQYNLANGILFWCSIYSAKASLLALYWKVFEISRAFRLMWIGSMAYMILSFIATIMIRVTVCGRLQDVLNQSKLKKILRQNYI